MSSNDKILHIEQLTVSFDGFSALDELTLHIEPGELRCVIGPNGAGKTTMMDVITGKTRPESGRRGFAKSSTCFPCPNRKSRRLASGGNFKSPRCSSN